KILSPCATDLFEPRDVLNPAPLVLFVDLRWQAIRDFANGVRYEPDVSRRALFEKYYCSLKKFGERGRAQTEQPFARLLSAADEDCRRRRGTGWRRIIHCAHQHDAHVIGAQHGLLAASVRGQDVEPAQMWRRAQR